MRNVHFPQLVLIITILIFVPLILQAQQSLNDGDHCADRSAEVFPELIFADIPGAPKLSKPFLIVGETQPLMGEGMGWAAPALYDLDGDGKKDLLIGEFRSGLEKGNAVGNFVRVYFNKSLDSIPKFTDAFQYITPPFGSGDGTPLSIFTWCCMAFRPQFIDLNADGLKDMITGQYHPGDVTWFQGTQNGFLPGVKLKQAGNSAARNIKLPGTDINSLWYWNYSSANFGDIDNDGDYDMIVGGAALRISKNIGTKTKPKFGPRELLLDINNEPLKLYNVTKEDIEKDPEQNMYLSGVFNAAPLVHDWDNDGMPDILVTTGYFKKGENSVVFFKGVKTLKGYRFNPGVPLFTASNGGKAFPGSWLRVFVEDWNNDRVDDLIIGTSVATIDGRFDSSLSWSWESETGIIKKNPGLLSKETKETIKKQIEEAEERGDRRKKEDFIKAYYGIGNYQSLVHKGYVYVMLGQKK